LSDRNGDIHARNATNFGVQMGNRSFDGHHDNDDDDELPAGSWFMGNADGGVKNTRGK